MTAARHLSVVKEPPPDVRDPGGATPDLPDIALLGALFVLNLVPVVAELAGIGHWSPAIVGFAAGAALLTGRELWSQLCARARAGS
jgi:hypothetical protein